MAMFLEGDTCVVPLLYRKCQNPSQKCKKVQLFMDIDQQCERHHLNILFVLLYLKLSSLPRVRGSVEDSDSYVLGEMIGFHQRK